MKTPSKKTILLLLLFTTIYGHALSSPFECYQSNYDENTSYNSLTETTAWQEPFSDTAFPPSSPFEEVSFADALLLNMEPEPGDPGYNNNSGMEPDPGDPGYNLPIKDGLGTFGVAVLLYGIFTYKKERTNKKEIAQQPIS
jgi:hypothetical protein